MTDKCSRSYLVRNWFLWHHNSHIFIHKASVGLQLAMYRTCTCHDGIESLKSVQVYCKDWVADFYLASKQQHIYTTATGCTIQSVVSLQQSKLQPVALM